MSNSVKANVEASVSLAEKSGKGDIGAIRAADAAIWTALPAADRGKAYETYVSCVLAQTKKDTTLKGVAAVAYNVPTTPPSTLYQNLQNVANANGAVLKISPDCKKEYLDSIVTPGEVRALSPSVLMERLSMKLDTSAPKATLVVTSPDAGQFDATCT